MNRFVTQFAAAAGLALMASTAWAQGSATPYPGEIEGKVHYIFKQQQEIEMADGTMLSATSPQQLEGLNPGTSVRVLFVDNGDAKQIQSIEVIAK